MTKMSFSFSISNAGPGASQWLLKFDQLGGMDGILLSKTDLKPMGNEKTNSWEVQAPTHRKGDPRAVSTCSYVAWYD